MSVRLSDLPQEIKLIVYEHCPCPAKVQLAGTSKEWMNIAQDINKIRSELIKKYWQRPCHRHENGEFKSYVKRQTQRKGFCEIKSKHGCSGNMYKELMKTILQYTEKGDARFDFSGKLRNMAPDKNNYHLTYSQSKNFLKSVTVSGLIREGEKRKFDFGDECLKNITKYSYYSIIGKVAEKVIDSETNKKKHLVDMDAEEFDRIFDMEERHGNS